jgi:hypothetical protein
MFYSLQPSVIYHSSVLGLFISYNEHIVKRSQKQNLVTLLATITLHLLRCSSTGGPEQQSDPISNGPLPPDGPRQEESDRVPEGRCDRAGGPQPHHLLQQQELQGSSMFCCRCRSSSGRERLL